MTVAAPDPASFAPLPQAQLDRWQGFGSSADPFFSQVVGLQVEELRTDYARMRLPYRPALNQPAGVVHGGALATLVDTVVVPAIATAYDDVPLMLTLNLNLAFLGAVREQDAIAHGWIVRRGRSIVFCEALVTTPDGTPAVSGTLTYSVRHRS